MMKTSAEAYAIQGLVKYHGLKDVTRRIPYHDSISVCAEALKTTTTVEPRPELSADDVALNGMPAEGRPLERIITVLDAFRNTTGEKIHCKVASMNNVTLGKGLGFSAAGFAALGYACNEAFGTGLEEKKLSGIVRLGAGSATRSLAGGYAIWYADRDGHSYGENLAGPEAVDMGMVIVPVASDISTDLAHAEAVSSPFFQARMMRISEILPMMLNAISRGGVREIGSLAEEDSLSLHAVTMTGPQRITLWETETVKAIREVQRMRSEGLEVWFSMDTGPSVFVNTYTDFLEVVAARLRSSRLNVFVSRAGGKPHSTEEHLF